MKDGLACTAAPTQVQRSARPTPQRKSTHSRRVALIGWAVHVSGCAGDAGVTFARMWLLVLVVPIALAGLTAMGARRRGAGIAISAVAGVCFPFTWSVWYLRDEHPYRHIRA